jgi:hypothetical protein
MPIYTPYIKKMNLKQNMNAIFLPLFFKIIKF